MAIACPSCDTRFRDPPEAVLRTRPLQCGKCDHKWRVAEQDTTDADKVVVEAPSMVPSMDDLVEGGDDAIRTSLPVVVADVPEDTPSVSAKREPIYVDVLEPQEAGKSAGTALAMGVLALMMLIGGAVLFRDAIMQTMPETVPYYRTAGLYDVAPGLEIANVVTTKSNKDGIRELIVKGEIANVAANTVPVPPIHLIMRDGSRANLYEWTVSASKPSLKAGERGRFTAIARDVPDGAVDVEVSFAQ